ncbi:hypothetical protein SBA1_950007 [Candidatus Sulfotelmatobacter kueseliae]|uniref:Uncharacterized protein n=1 Tax=Candidatus Sulfotelmatobacter kueseliae TaxID=2042962 RepID=A0A2U3LD96_9BACT|nr:hypothetical protein SBA1_950007 [Candidatus Sulfotelmatobacter kueseliae]
MISCIMPTPWRTLLAPSTSTCQTATCLTVHCGLLVGPLPIVPLHSLEIPLSTESPDSFVASAAASIASGWSEPVPGRELHPLTSAFHGALLRQQPTTETSLVIDPKPKD